MDIPVTTPALLFPAIAILMLGYVNRYLGTSSLVRTIKKDYDTGYKRVDITHQLHILARRIELSRHMLTMGSVALMLACLAMFFIFIQQQELGNKAFGLSIAAMITSILISLYETSLSNKSLFIEINDIFKKENHK
jgi:methylmalonyl-CoA mutase N-terminal domain/subunit